MCGGVVAQKRVLNKKDTDGRYIGVRCPCAPAFPFARARAIVEGREDKMCRLESRGFRQGNDGKGRYAKTLQGNGGVDEVAQRANTEEIGGAMREQDDGKDAESFPGGRVVPIDDCCGGGDQVCQGEIYSGGDGDLAKKVEPSDVSMGWWMWWRRAGLPASDPSKEWRMLLWSKHVCPEVGTTGCRDRGEDFGHAGAHKEC